MDSAGDELGRSITQACEFLRQVFEDVHQLLVALDGLMAERAWRPTEKRVTYGLSSGMDPSGWLIQYASRFYVPAGSETEFRELIVFVIRFEPPRAFDQPVVLGALARFPDPVTYEAVFQRWKTTEIALEALAGRPGPRRMAAPEVDQFLPAASDVVANAVPLCSLTGTDALLSRCVAPLLSGAPSAGLSAPTSAD